MGEFYAKSEQNLVEIKEFIKVNINNEVAACNAKHHAETAISTLELYFGVLSDEKKNASRNDYSAIVEIGLIDGDEIVSLSGGDTLSTDNFFARIVLRSAMGSAADDEKEAKVLLRYERVLHKVLSRFDNTEKNANIELLRKVRGDFEYGGKIWRSVTIAFKVDA